MGYRMLCGLPNCLLLKLRCLTAVFARTYCELECNRKGNS